MSIMLNTKWRNVDKKCKNVNREYIHSFAVYQKYLTRLGELIIFEPWNSYIAIHNKRTMMVLYRSPEYQVVKV